MTGEHHEHRDYLRVIELETKRERVEMSKIPMVITNTKHTE
jgi:hypothetical protein